MSRKSTKYKNKGKKLSANQLKGAIKKLYLRFPRKRFHAKQLIKKLKIDNSKDAVNHALETLTENNFLILMDGFKYRLNKAAVKQEDLPYKLFEGTVDMTRTGSAFIISEETDNDIYVPAKRMNFALHGDKVQVAVRNWKGGRRPEGEIFKVLERSTEHFLGTLHLSRKYGIVIPDRLNMPVDIYVNLDDLKGANDRDKVVVKVVEWPHKMTHSPKGKITSVLGKVGGSDLEMKAILIGNGFELDFDDAVLKEAEDIPKEITAAEVNRRRDMRQTMTFTIDPADAKDFDDALSIEDLGNGAYEIGIHIADVTHYVKPKTELDKAASKQATSVYLVDRVLPMLPEVLSNGLCSLRPNEDKYTFSAIFKFDKDGKVTDRWFGKTVIHSDRRFSYEEAQQVLETGKGDLAEELTTLNRIAKILRKKKFDNGAIAFESDEVKFRLDENGAPIEVYLKERKDAHMLIEDFMLLANREVATYIQKKGKAKEIPFVYRVHDKPDMEKVADFALFAKQMGFQMKLDTPKQIIDSFNNLSKKARNNEKLKILEPLAIRTMAKAIYTTDNVGHYGLGFDNYAHFTSPIRRYADVLVHRLLEKNLGKEIHYTDKGILEEQCKHISAQEKKAQESERESTKYKQVEFLEKNIGSIYEGRISGFNDRGFFVELIENRCEGMVGFETMDESFDVGPGRLSAKGNRSGKVLKIGDTLDVKITNADLARRRIDFEVAEPL